MTEMKTNRTAKLVRILLPVMLILFGVRLVGSTLFDPYATNTDQTSSQGIFLILSGLILPFMLFPKSGKHTETPSDDMDD